MPAPSCARYSNHAGRGQLDRDDDALVRARRDRDVQVFNEFVERRSGMMLRLALTHAESGAIAGEALPLIHTQSRARQIPYSGSGDRFRRQAGESAAA